MNNSFFSGEDFYKKLQDIYKEDGKKLYGNYSFKCWLKKNDGSLSFQFNGCIPPKSITKESIIAAKNAKNRNDLIDRNWFKENFQFDDCRASIAIWLLINHPC